MRLVSELGLQGLTGWYGDRTDEPVDTLIGANGRLPHGFPAAAYAATRLPPPTGGQCVRSRWMTRAARSTVVTPSSMVWLPVERTAMP